MTKIKKDSVTKKHERVIIESDEKLTVYKCSSDNNEVRCVSCLSGKGCILVAEGEETDTPRGCLYARDKPKDWCNNHCVWMIQ
jgi:hypothetical protein